MLRVMERETELVTVFRSADASAKRDAAEVRAALAEAGVQAELFGDDAPGVPSGAVEVRVPAAEVGRAEALIASLPDDEREAEPVDPSHVLDPVTIFRSDAHNAEMEALAIRGILEASGIPCLIVGAPMYPNLPFEVRVPKSRLEEAKQVIAESEAAGEQVAEEAGPDLEDAQ